MAEVHPSAVIHEDVKLSEGVVIGPNCVIDSGVSIEVGTVLDANVVIGKNVELGKGNHLFANCAIGCLPQVLGLNSDSKFGGIIIGDNNVIREQVTIHPSMYPGEFTKVGNDNLIMIGVHIGHDCILEDKIVMSNYVQMSGHCKIGTGVWLSGMVLLHQFVTIGDWVYAAGLAGINHDIPSFLMVSDHYPARVRGVNKRGLARAGLTEQQQKKIYETYKRLYRRGGTLLDNAKALAGEGDLDENIQTMVDVILKSSEHRYGRYLETLRH
ncbi:MAG: acyl-ACP--UDP-N-acetylglucosamine O-acyltransferase [Planctomycetes bacterium]|nr:acyl-ACP--UDP-N-acetylglucosamine O-acyltransferase [Planctomycetota bacterium]